MKEITLILVDDHQLFLTGLAQMLAEEPDIRIIRSFTNAEQAHQFLKKHDVAIVIRDLDMPNFTGIELIKGIRQLKPEQKVIVLSMIDQRSIINRKINYDVNGYLMKNDAQAELADAIRKVYDGEHYYNVDIRSMLFKEGEKATPPSKKIPRLSKREKEVLQLIIAEMTTPEIAKALFISSGTVISHCKRILSKLGAKNSAGVVRIALEMGLV